MENLIALLPYALLLLCPAMMLFMMRGHGHDDHAQHHAEQSKPSNELHS